MDLRSRLSNPNAPALPPVVTALQQRQAHSLDARPPKPALTAVAVSTSLAKQQAWRRLRLSCLDRQTASFRWPLLRLAYLLAYQQGIAPLTLAAEKAPTALAQHGRRNNPELWPAVLAGRRLLGQVGPTAQAGGGSVSLPSNVAWITAVRLALAYPLALSMVRWPPMGMTSAFLMDEPLHQSSQTVIDQPRLAQLAPRRLNQVVMLRTGVPPFAAMQQAKPTRQPVYPPFPISLLLVAGRSEGPSHAPMLPRRTEGQLLSQGTVAWPVLLPAEAAEWGDRNTWSSMRTPLALRLLTHPQSPSTPSGSMFGRPSGQVAVTIPDQLGEIGVRLSPALRFLGHVPPLPAVAQVVAHPVYRPLTMTSPATLLHRQPTPTLLYGQSPPRVRRVPQPSAVPALQPVRRPGVMVATLSSPPNVWPGVVEPLPMPVHQRSTARGITALPATPRPQPQWLSRGNAIEADLRTRLEKMVGFDLGAVRLHTDSAATALAAHMHAQAFTVGSHIFFGAGRFQPQTQPGLALVLHELVHVRQQPGGLPLAAEALTPMQQRTLEQDAQTRTTRLLRGAPAPLVGGNDSAYGAKQVNTLHHADPMLATPGGDNAFPRLHLAWATHALTAAPLRQEESASRIVTPPPGMSNAAPAATNSAPPVELERLAQQVYTLLERRQRFDQERKGIQLWR